MSQLLTLSLLFCLFSNPLFAKDERIILVQGEGQAAGVPDIAVVHFSINTQDKNALKAQKDNAAQAQKVIDLLKKEFKLDHKNIQTQSFNVSPRYQYLERQKIFEGYEVVNQLQIEWNKISQLGELLDALARAQVQNIHSISFRISNTKTLEQLALENALEHARTKAQYLAKKAGRKLGDVMRIQEGGANSDPMPFRRNEKAMFASASADVSTPIEAGEQSVRAQISVWYELK